MGAAAVAVALLFAAAVAGAATVAAAPADPPVEARTTGAAAAQSDSTTPAVAQRAGEAAAGRSPKATSFPTGSPASPPPTWCDATAWICGARSVDAPLPPASLAKLMTALLVVEAGRADDVVTVSARAAGTGGARVGLRTGERLSVSALLAALLLRSANDACIALAEWRDGSEKAFVARMNARAAKLGLAGTHFAGACGLDAAGQRSSARDLAALAERVLRQPALAALAARERMTIRSEGDRVFALVNTNAMLGRIPGVDGLKTGFTNGAGRCLVVSAERGGVRVLAVLLGAGDRWWDAVAMVEQAFDAPAPRDGRGR